MTGQRRHPHAVSATAAAPPPDWPRLLANARNEDEVLELCTRRLASLTASEIHGLPRDCRPVELEDRADLAVYALALLRRQNAELCCSPLLAALAQFFALANVRVAQVLRQVHVRREADALLSRMDRRRRRDPGSQPIE